MRSRLASPLAVEGVRPAREAYAIERTCPCLQHKPSERIGAPSLASRTVRADSDRLAQGATAVDIAFDMLKNAPSPGDSWNQCWN